MKEKINIAEILKNKPEKTILYDAMRDINVSLYVVEKQNGETNIFCDGMEKFKGCSFVYSDTGADYIFRKGMQLLKPSKEMRDWEKFSWKKGDVLVNKDGDVHIIFEKFEDDAYKNFHGQYYLWEEGGSMVSFEEDENYMQTSDFNKANKEDAQEYIHKIEKILGGKLNRETLEIEKTQPEFKDGDIVFMKGIKSELFANCIFILKGEYKDGDERAFYYAFYNADDKFTEAEYGNTKVHYSLRSATDSEKQQLFDALAKKGKTWDSENKEVVNLKPKVELKPFDKVLSRRCSEDYWVLNFYSHKTDYYHICIDGSSNLYCIPYNEETAHLLGTTDEWKGGEG